MSKSIAKQIRAKFAQAKQALANTMKQAAVVPYTPCTSTKKQQKRERAYWAKSDAAYAAFRKASDERHAKWQAEWAEHLASKGL